MSGAAAQWADCCRRPPQHQLLLKQTCGCRGCCCCHVHSERAVPLELLHARLQLPLRTPHFTC